MVHASVGGYPQAAWNWWKRDGLVTGGAYGTNMVSDCYLGPTGG